MNDPLVGEKSEKGSPGDSPTDSDSYSANTEESGKKDPQNASGSTLDSHF